MKMKFQYIVIFCLILNVFGLEFMDLSPFYYSDLKNSYDNKWRISFEDIFSKYCKCDGSKRFTIIGCKDISNQLVLKNIFDRDFKRQEFGKFLLFDSKIKTINNILIKDIKFKFISIKKTSLTSLDLNVFNKSFPVLTRLEIIHNNLDTIPFDKSSQLPQLRHLDLYYNSLTTIPDNMFEKLTNLRTIDMSYNQISYVGSNAFYFNDKLQYLDIKYNKLKVVNNKAFALNKPNPRLTIDLTNNKMFYLSDDVFLRQSPLLLNLSANSLTKFPQKHFWPIIESMIQYRNGMIAVENNRFNCLCEQMDWILRLPNDSKQRIIGFSCINRNNQYLNTISYKDVCNE